MRGGRETPRAGARGRRDGGTRARRAGSGLPCGSLGEPGQALRALRARASEVLAPPGAASGAKALPAGGRGRRAHLRPPGSPPPPAASQRDAGPRPPRGADPPRALPRAQALLFRRRAKVLAGGDWERQGPARPWPPRSLPQLRALASRATPQSSRAPSLQLPSPLGRSCVREAGKNLGRCLLASRSCILSRRLLLAAEESDEYRAVEQVVPEMEVGKPVVFCSKVSFS